MKNDFLKEQQAFEERMMRERRNGAMKTDANGLIGFIISLILTFFVFRYNLFGKILASAEPGNSNAFMAAAFFCAIYLLFMIFGISGLLDYIRSKLSKKSLFDDSLTPKVYLLSCITSCTSASIWILTGLLFIAVSVLMITGVMGPVDAPNIFAGFFVFLFGAAPFLIGVAEVISNVDSYRAFISGVDPDENPGFWRKFVLLVNKHVLQLIFGLIFALVPFLMLAAAGNTPDMDKFAVLMIVAMGLLFGGIGVYVLYKTIKGMKDEYNGYSDMDDDED